MSANSILAEKEVKGTRDDNRGAWQTASSLSALCGQSPRRQRFGGYRLEKQMGDSIAALFQRLTLGVYVVGVAHGEARNAFTAAWVTQVSFNPLLLALSIDPHHSSYRLVKEGRAFSVNVLKKGQLELAEHFGRSASSDKLAEIEWTQGCAGLPLLLESLAWFECRLVDEYPVGDHMLVLGHVIGGKLLDPEAEPLSYRETGAMDGAAVLFPDAFDD
jgi:flavin reductase (DIM6/NTAB) family NADH-FMN oxidoreductase RutF